MFATQTNRIKHLTSDQYAVLRELCHYAKNLYNVALYNIRQHYFATGGMLSYAQNCRLCKDNENFKMLQAGVSQQIIRMATQSFRSFLALKRKAANGEYAGEKVRIPRYLEKDGHFQMVLSTNAISIKDSYLRLPVSHAFVQAHPGVDIRIPFPARIDSKCVREVRISPAHNARFFEAEYVSNDKRTMAHPSSLDENRIMGIDLGVDNLAACAAITGQLFLIDGRVLKANNQWYNKERARLQSINDKQGRKGETRKMACLAVNRDNFTTDYMRKAARYVVDVCLAENIGTLVVGVNQEQKQNINIGHVNNQNFVLIPLWKFRRLLGNLCERHGITYVEIEESYTSRASFLDRDALPVYDPTLEISYSFSGRRISRGLYRGKTGCIINADINGAANVIRKYRPDADFSLLDKAIALNPRRIRILRTVRKKPHACPIKSKAAAQATA